MEVFLWHKHICSDCNHDVLILALKLIWTWADEQTWGIPKFIGSFVLMSCKSYEIIEFCISLSLLWSGIAIKNVTITGSNPLDFSKNICYAEITKDIKLKCLGKFQLRKEWLVCNNLTQESSNQNSREVQIQWENSNRFTVKRSRRHCRVGENRRTRRLGNAEDGNFHQTIASWEFWRVSNGAGADTRPTA